MIFTWILDCVEEYTDEDEEGWRDEEELMEDVLKTVLRDDGAVEEDEERDTEEWDEKCWMDEVFNGGWRMVDVVVDDWLMSVEDRWGNDGLDEGIIPELDPPL